METSAEAACITPTKGVLENLMIIGTQRIVCNLAYQPEQPLPSLMAIVCYLAAYTNEAYANLMSLLSPVARTTATRVTRLL